MDLFKACSAQHALPNMCGETEEQGEQTVIAASRSSEIPPFCRVLLRLN